LTNRFLVMLYDDHGIAEVAQALEGCEKATVVSLVQADARLVENVEHATETRSDLRCEANSLRLATRQRLRRSVEREVVQPDIQEKPETLAHFLEDRAGDFRVESARVVRLEADTLEELNGFRDGQVNHVTDSPVGNGYAERLGLEALAAAHIAGLCDHVRLQFQAYGVRVRLIVPALNAGKYPLPAHLTCAGSFPSS